MNAPLCNVLICALIGSALLACADDASTGPSDEPDATEPPGDAAVDAGSRSVDAAQLVDAQAKPDAGPAPVAEICDGSDELRLVYQRQTAFARLAYGEQVVFQHGTQFLFVRGDCAYWAWTSETFNPSQETRHGMLDADAASALAADLRYGQWEDLAGQHGQPLDDAPPEVLFDGTERVVCFARCETGAPDAARTLHATAERWLIDLYEQGEPMTGPVRVAAADISAEFPQWSYSVFEWELSVPLSDVTLPPATGGPIEGDLGFLIEDADDIAVLRAARSDQLEERFHPAFVGGFIPTSETGGALHSLWVRDVLPFENAGGSVDY